MGRPKTTDKSQESKKDNVFSEAAQGENWKTSSRVPVTQDQIRVAQMVDSSPNDAPIIEDINDLFIRDELAVPFGIGEKYPERSYKWLALDDTSELAQHGGMYVVVTRSNHPDVPTQFFEDSTGAIVYKGQNFLAFTRRENVDRINAHILKDFGKRVDSLTNFGTRQIAEGVHLDQLEEGKDFNATAGRDFPLEDSLPDRTPDFV